MRWHFTHTVFAVFINCTLACAQPCQVTAEDRDGDCISDDYEHYLLQQFAPVFYTDDAYTGPTQYVGIPVEASWFMAHANLTTDNNTVVLARPTTSEALNYLRSIEALPDAVGSHLRLPFMPNGNPRWGYSDVGQPRSWPIAISNGDGVYGHVWRPFPGQYPNILSVQYYMLLTWNQPDNCGTSNGEHDGDIISVDYGVDVSDAANPKIVHAIYHNHGRQILCTRDALRFESGHPVVYMEQQDNEVWPNPHGSIGYAGWPDSDGYAINWVFEFGYDCGDIDPLAQLCGFSGGEEAAVRGHSGLGLRYQSFNVPNLGEAYCAHPNCPGSPTVFYPLADADAELFLRYAGKWGITGDPPDGPAFQSNGRKMWRREFGIIGLCYDSPRAPYAVGNPDPIYPDLDATMRFGDEPYGGCGAEDPGYLYFRCNTYFLPVCYVGPNGNAPPWGGDGRRTAPFLTIRPGLDHVASFGSLRVVTGTWHTNGAITISRPMEIRAVAGPVTILP